MPPENLHVPQEAQKTPNFSDPKVIVVTVLLGIYIVVLLLFHFIAIIYSTYLLTKRRKRVTDELENVHENRNIRTDSGHSEVRSSENSENSGSSENSTNSANSENIQNSDNYPKVTILKPLYGSDLSLESRLESFFNLTYPSSRYKVYFCLQTEDDEATPVCKKLQAKYSKKNNISQRDSKSIDSKLFIDYTNHGANPKINNMLSAWNEATQNSDLIWICDAGIHALPETLSDMVNRLVTDPKAAICHGLPFFKSKSNRAFGQLVEKTYFGTQHGRHYLVWNLLGVNCMNGQSTLIKLAPFKKSIGGLEELSNHLAEDFFMGKALDDSGFNLVLSRYPALQDPFLPEDINVFRRYIKRMVRWTRLRMTMIPGVCIAEPFTECMISGLIIGLLATGVLFPYNWWIFVYIFSAHISIWFVFDCVLQFSMDTEFFKNDSIFRLFAAWWCREWVTIYILLKSIYNLTSVSWGNVSFHVARGGQTEVAQTGGEIAADDDTSSKTHSLIRNDLSDNGTLGEDSISVDSSSQENSRYLSPDEDTMNLLQHAE